MKRVYSKWIIFFGQQLSGHPQARWRNGVSVLIVGRACDILAKQGSHRLRWTFVKVFLLGGTNLLRDGCEQIVRWRNISRVLGFGHALCKKGSRAHSWETLVRWTVGSVTERRLWNGDVGGFLGIM